MIESQMIHSFHSIPVVFIKICILIKINYKYILYWDI